MKLKGLIFGVLAIAWIFLSMGCNGLRSKKQNYDSLFLGFSLGMEKKAFYDLCWEYNRKKMLTHGPTNQNVEYKLEGITKSSVNMRFYPTFEKDKIYEMPVTFTYEGWAPWNRQYQSDSLLQDMVGVFKKWYGDDFKTLDHATQGKIYYKFDGKRRINLFIKDDQFVQAVFTDMEVDEQLKEKEQKSKEQPVNQ